MARLVAEPGCKGSFAVFPVFRRTVAGGKT
jgi:hypothetical protein